MYVHMDASAHKKQKRVLHPLGLELKVVVNSLMWKLGTKLKTSQKTVNTINSWASAPSTNSRIFWISKDNEIE